MHFYDVFMLLEKDGDEAKSTGKKGTDTTEDTEADIEDPSVDDTDTGAEENPDDTDTADDTDGNPEDDMDMDMGDDTDTDTPTDDDTTTDDPTSSDDTTDTENTETETTEDTSTPPNEATKKINLINSYELLYNTLSEQITDISMISVNNEEENEYLQDVISKLVNIRRYLFDYITIELKKNTYEKNLYTFYSFKDIIKINIKIVEKIIDLRKNN